MRAEVCANFRIFLRLPHVRRLNAKGVIYTSPGQRPGVVGCVSCRLKACLILDEAHRYVRFSRTLSIQYSERNSRACFLSSLAQLAAQRNSPR